MCVSYWLVVVLALTEGSKYLSMCSPSELSVCICSVVNVHFKTTRQCQVGESKCGILNRQVEVDNFCTDFGRRGVGMHSFCMKHDQGRRERVRVPLMCTSFPNPPRPCVRSRTSSRTSATSVAYAGSQGNSCDINICFSVSS